MTTMTIMMKLLGVFWNSWNLFSSFRV